MEGGNTLISIEKLRKVFKQGDKEITAVDSLTLNIEKGEIFGVIGYSGAGKSTLARLINRLEEPTSGNIIIDQRDITTLRGKHLRQARQNIGMIFQHFNLLWSRTTEENIAFPLEIAKVPKKEREERVQELIDLVGLTGREKAYPAQLSGGQKQRVGIARALANRPQVLLSDEATSALDPETTNSILDLLVDINQKLGITIIVITHEMHVIRKICDRVAVMEDGKVVEHGKVIDVFTNPQQRVTKKFVEQLMTAPDTEAAFSETLAHIERTGKVLRLQFKGSFANETLISDVSKQFPVVVNIIDGKITNTKSGLLGTLTIQIKGEQSAIDEAETYIKGTSVEVEVIRDDT